VAEELAQADKGGGFLRRLAGKKSREAPRKSETRYDLEGNAWTIPVTEMVGFLSHSGKSGLHRITSPTGNFVLVRAREPRARDEQRAAGAAASARSSEQKLVDAVRRSAPGRPRSRPTTCSGATSSAAAACATRTCSARWPSRSSSSSIA
jgi:hypothetical protein